MTGIDTHAHVFVRSLPLAEARRYTPDYDALAQDYVRQLDENGLSHGVLVQPSFLGTDNGFMLDALRQYPDRLRGIAVVEPGVSRAVLAEMAESGVAGIRLNLIGCPLPDLCSAPWRMLMRQVAEFGWLVEVHCRGYNLSKLIGPLLDHGVNVVVDHFGRPDPELGTDDPGFRYLLSLAESGRVWVKLSAPYRNGPAGRGEVVAHDAVPLLRGAFGLGRLLWGSDWPHTRFERAATFRSTYACLKLWLPDRAERAVVLVDSPSELFWFAPLRCSALPETAATTS